MRTAFFTIVILLLFPSAILSLGLINLHTTLMSPRFLKAELNKANFYQRIVKVDAGQLAADLSNEESRISAAQISQIQTALNPKTLKELVESAIDNSTNGKPIKMTSLKNDLKSKIGAGADEFLKNIPDEYAQPVSGFSKYIKYLPGGYMVSLFFTAILFIGAMLLASTWGGRVQVLAWLAVVLGILSILFSVGIRLIPITTIKLSSLTDLATDLFGSMKTAYQNRVFLEGIILTGLAIVLFVVSFFIPRPAIAAAPKVPAKTTV